MKKRGRGWTLLIVAGPFGCTGLFLWRTGFFEAVSSLESLRRYLEEAAPFGQLFFFLLQLASVVLAPIPNNIVALAGAVLFGTWQAFFLTAVAVQLGSMVVFLLARTLGRPFVERLVSTKVSERYLEVIKRKRDIFLVLVFLFPFFPDDLICILAGLTDIKAPRFCVLVALTRHWGLLMACLLGGATLTLPLWVMVLLGIGGVALFLVCLKYGDRWEQVLLERFRR